MTSAGNRACRSLTARPSRRPCRSRSRSLALRRCRRRGRVPYPALSHRAWPGCRRGASRRPNPPGFSSSTPLSSPGGIAGFVAITAFFELGVPLDSPLIKLCVLIGAPHSAIANARRDRPNLAGCLGRDGRPTRAVRLAWVAVNVPVAPAHCGCRVRAAWYYRSRLAGRAGHFFAVPTAALPTSRPAVASHPGWPPRSNNCSRCGTSLVFGAVDGEHRDRLLRPACRWIAYSNT